MLATRGGMHAPPGVRAAAALFWIVLCIVLAAYAGRRIARGTPDFEFFYKAGAAMLARGGLDSGCDVLADGTIERRGTIEWYLPFTSRLMTLLAWMPQRVAGAIWVGANLLAMLTILRLLGVHLMGLPARDWAVTQVVPFVALSAYWFTEFGLNQIDTLTLLLLVAGFVHWQQRRRLASGLWLGLATLIKLTPAIVVLWFVLKRQYRVAAAAVATIGLFGPVSDVLVLGTGQTVDVYRTWIRNAVHSGSHAGLIREQREMDWRNQGLGAVLSRWLHETNWARHFDNDPRVAADSDPPQFMNVVSLRREQVVLIVQGLAVASVLGLVWLARRPAGELSPWALRFEWALFVLAMLWLMPVMRQYHMIWATPAVSLLAAAVHHVGHRSRAAWAIYAVLSLVLLAQLALFSEAIKARGVTLASVPVLAAPLIALLVRYPRSALPPAAAEQDAQPAPSARLAGAHG
ncbi:MAG: hypothetical protein CHACPFDD_02319 [Phycisphaerae bacterium]|nr:hypothetical protein [Phycisphaerae bacterium]